MIVQRAVDWHKLGIQLDVPDNILTNIDMDYHHNSRKLSEVLKYWKRNSKASWKKVVEALERIGDYGNTIAEIRSKYMGGEHDIVLSDQLSSIHDSELASFQRTAVGENDRCVQFEHYVVNYVHTYLYFAACHCVVVVFVCVHMCTCVCVCVCTCMCACYVSSVFIG